MPVFQQIELLTVVAARADRLDRGVPRSVVRKRAEIVQNRFVQTTMISTGRKVIGASCLVWCGDALVLEVQKPAKWRVSDDGGVHIGLGCVGGGLDEGETSEEALQREALEEIGCRLELRDAPVTHVVTPACQVLARDWSEPGVRPVLVWEACLPGLLPGKRVAVFRGRPLKDPFPGDLPALLSVTPALLWAIGQGGMRLRDARDQGARLQARVAIPDMAWLGLVGTPAVLDLLRARSEPVVQALIEPV